MKPFAQARLLHDFGDDQPRFEHVAVTNEIPAKKKTKMSREKLSGFLPNSF